LTTSAPTPPAAPPPSSQPTANLSSANRAVRHPSPPTASCFRTGGMSSALPRSRPLSALASSTCPSKSPTVHSCSAQSQSERTQCTRFLATFPPISPPTTLVRLFDSSGEHATPWRVTLEPRCFLRPGPYGGSAVPACSPRVANDGNATGIVAPYVRSSALSGCRNRSKLIRAPAQDIYQGADLGLEPGQLAVRPPRLYTKESSSHDHEPIAEVKYQCALSLLMGCLPSCCSL
jgi:hypothetical protein